MRAHVPGPFVRATAAYVLGFLAQNTYLFYVAPIALRGETGGAQAWTFAASAFSTMLAVVPAGMLADRIPRRRAMRIGLALLALSYAPVLLAEGLRATLPASVLSGTGLAFLTVSFNAYVADLLASERTSSAYGYAGASAILGAAAGPFLAAAIFRQVPDEALALRLASGLLAMAALAGILLSLGLPSARGADSAPTLPRPPAEARRAVGGVALLYVFLGASFGLTAPYFSVHFLEHARLANEAWGVLLGLGTVASACGFLLAGALGRRHAPGPLLVAGQGLALLVLAPFLLPLGVVVLGAAYLARQLFANAFAPFVNAALMRAVDARGRAAAQGWVSLAWNGGWACGALAGGPLLAALGPAAFPLGASLGVAGVLAGRAALRPRA